MKRLCLAKIRRISPVFLILVIVGCAAVPKKPPEPPAPPAPPVVMDPFSVLLERYRNKATEFEKNGELRKALQSWEVVNSFTPTDQQVVKRTADLKAKIFTLANQHFKKALSYYQSNSMQAACKEFLIVLYYNPDHQEALYYLKQKLTGEDYALYKVKRGDTLKEIARKTFNDPDKDFLIAYFNDLRMDANLIPDSTLKLPILELTPVKSTMETKEAATDVTEIPVDTKEMLSKALVYYKAKNYRDTLSISEKILKYDPANRGARELVNESYYQMGKLSIQGKNYPEALEIFSRVDSGYKDVSESITFAKKQLAGEHYLQGVKYYTDLELDKAIKEWETTLALDPNHPKAKKDIENARSLLQKLQEIK